MDLIREADRRQTPLAEGCRSLQEWVAGRLDVSAETASALVRTARTLDELPHLTMAVEEGRMSLDRTAEVVRLACPDDELDVMLTCEGLDIDGIRRRAAMRHRVSRKVEREAFAARHVFLQPNLDASRWRVAGVLPGFVGSVVDRALVERGDALPDLPDRPSSRGQRNADALWAMAQDTLNGHNGDNGDRGAPVVTVFVDATDAASTGGEAGAVIGSGPRVGPETLEMILCTGAVEVTAIAADGVPLGVGSTGRAIPPRLRRFVLARDGGCVADGCRSRYRLQPTTCSRTHSGPNTTRRTWSVSVGSTITSSSTATATASTPPARGVDSASSTPRPPAAHPDHQRMPAIALFPRSISQRPRSSPHG